MSFQGHQFFVLHYAKFQGPSLSSASFATTKKVR